MDNFEALLEAHTPQSLSGIAWRVESADQDTALASLSASLAGAASLARWLSVAPDGAPRDPLFVRPWLRAAWPRGNRFQTSRGQPLWVGSLELETALAETAYRQARFWQASQAEGATLPRRSRHTAYSFAYHCPQGARLEQPPFRALRDTLTGADWRPCQQLSEQLQQRGYRGWEYPSACCPHFGLNLLLLDPAALSAQRPGEQHSWLCEVTPREVLMSSGERLLRYPLPPP